MTVRATVKYRDSSSRTSSGSRVSDIVVKPTRSPKSTDVTRRSATRALGIGAGGATADGAVPVTGVPQSAQNRPVTGAPHAEQLLLWGVPQDGQNLADSATDSPQDGQLVTWSFLPLAQRQRARLARPLDPGRCPQQSEDAGGLVHEDRRVGGAAPLAQPLRVLEQGAPVPVRRTERREG